MRNNDEGMGDYQVSVIRALGWDGTGDWKSYPFFKTSPHAAKVEASSLIRFRFQKYPKLCELVDSSNWEKESDTLWSKSSDVYKIELRLLHGNYDSTF